MQFSTMQASNARVLFYIAVLFMHVLPPMDVETTSGPMSYFPLILDKNFSLSVTISEFHFSPCH